MKLIGGNIFIRNAHNKPGCYIVAGVIEVDQDIEGESVYPVFGEGGDTLQLFVDLEAGIDKTEDVKGKDIAQVLTGL